MLTLPLLNFKPSKPDKALSKVFIPASLAADRTDTLRRLATATNVQSSTVAQMVREFWRQFTVVPETRGFDYMTRTSSNETTSYFSESILRLMRVFYNVPLLETTLELDRLDKQPYLKAFGITEPVPAINMMHFPSLRDRLIDNRYGSDYKAIPRTMRMDKAWTQVFDEKSKHQVYQLQRLSPNHPLLHHLDYWLDFRKTLSKIGNEGYSLRKLPYFEDASVKEVKEAIKTVKTGLDHLETTGLSSFLYRANNLFREVEHGRYAVNGRLYLDSILFSLEKIQGSQFKGSINLPHQQFIKVLTKHIKASDKTPPLTPLQEAKKGFLSYFGMYKEPHEQAQAHLTKKYLQKLSNGTVSRELFKNLYEDMKAGSLQLGRKTLHFDFNEKALGLTSETADQAAQKVALCLSDLNGLLRQSVSEIKVLDTEQELQQWGQRLGSLYHKKLLELASAFPGQVVNEAGERSGASLEKVLKTGLDAPLGQLFKDGLRAEKVLIKTMRTIDKASFWPQIAFSIAGILTVYGPFRSFIDQQVVQPYQKKVVEKKGDTLGAWLPFLVGDVASIAAFLQVLNSSFLRNKMQNDYLLRGLLAAAVGTATMFAVTTAGVRALVAAKPDKPKPLPPLPTLGPNNAVNPLSPPTQETQLAYKQALQRVTNVSARPLSFSLSEPNLFMGASSLGVPQPVIPIPLMKGV